MGKMILIIDDSPTIRTLVSMTTQQGGYSSVQAANGQDALDKAKANKVDCVICDVNMPVMDGITFVKQFRQLPQYKTTPVIMLTTETQESKKMEGRAAGATGWIVKPFDKEALLKLLSRLV